MEAINKCHLYCRALDKARNNNYQWHVVALLKRNKSVIKVGVNSSKTNPNYKRAYPGDSCSYHIHAEMSVLCRAQPGDSIEVMRINKSGDLCMAKPCEHCMTAIRAAGISVVKYTDERGEWQSFKVREKQQ